MSNLYSRYMLRWDSKYGVEFAEPIRKRDEKLFTLVTCLFCHERFYVDCDLKPVPEACERCFRARADAKPLEMKPRSGASLLAGEKEP